MKIIAVLAFFLGITTIAQAGTIGSDVEVQLRTDSGRILPLYPAASGYQVQKAYAEAVKGENYSIMVSNRLNRRIGIVVAVDGRNIISGKKSWLRNNERMYILEPYESGEFSGWRTGSDRINRFFFTTAADSYAASFRDESAMGVIAMAVYPEVRRYNPPWHDSSQELSRNKSAGSAAPAARAEEKSAGTGYGREEYSPSTIVAFEPESQAVEKIFLKYEWRSTLCKKGIIRCGPTPEPRNRMWEGEGFAPPPGRY
ncbi:MAG: hypothetical protein PHD01_07760 [Geobacteraceae bacterium]|nr:hypothetical protein [Geobacteraceae bacterium]